MSSVRARMPAAERREALVDTALKVFSAGSFRGVTTAEIAQAAGVSEPILYRHFKSKRDLYLACLREGWERVRAIWDEAVEQEADPGNWLVAMGQAILEPSERKAMLGNLWVQALTEASDDPAIRRYMTEHMREVHEFVEGVIRRSQDRGGILPERDARAEAWIFVSLGFLAVVGRRLGGLLEDDLPIIGASRREWMTGRKP